MEVRPLSIKISYPLKSEQLNKLHSASILWGVRHNLISFEQLVGYSVSNYTNDSRLIDLACLTKSEYSVSGYNQLIKATKLIVLDDSEFHRQAADECFLLVIRQISDQLIQTSYQKSYTLQEVAPFLIFVNCSEWAGFPAESPYIFDQGPSVDIINKIVMLNRYVSEGRVNDAKLILQS